MKQEACAAISARDPLEALRGLSLEGGGPAALAAARQALMGSTYEMMEEVHTAVKAGKDYSAEIQRCAGMGWGEHAQGQGRDVRVACTRASGLTARLALP